MTRFVVDATAVLHLARTAITISARHELITLDRKFARSIKGVVPVAPIEVLTS